MKGIDACRFGWHVGVAGQALQWSAPICLLYALLTCTACVAQVCHKSAADCYQLRFSFNINPTYSQEPLPLLLLLLSDFEKSPMLHIMMICSKFPELLIVLGLSIGSLVFLETHMHTGQSIKLTHVHTFEVSSIMSREKEVCVSQYVNSVLQNVSVCSAWWFAESCQTAHPAEESHCCCSKIIKCSLHVTLCNLAGGRTRVGAKVRSQHFEV